MTTPGRDLALRAAVELAIKVARDGEEGEPAVPAPSAIKRFLHFQRLPPLAVAATAKVLDAEPSFRERVLEAARPDTVGAEGWLWLSRPAGWEQILDQLDVERAQQAADRADERGERRARRKVSAAEDAAARAAERVVELTDQLDAQKQELNAIRAERRSSARDAEQARNEAARLAEERTVAVRQLKDTESLLAERTAANRAQRAELSELREELRVLAEALAAADDTPSEGSRAPVRSDDEPGGGAAADLTAVAESVRKAAGAAAELAEALRSTAAGLAPPPRPEPKLDRTAPRSPGRRPRVALPVPLGVFDDSPAAVLHFARLPGAVFLIDGYNVTKGAWPDLLIGDQRQRLVDSLNDLHARTGLATYVVFDGVEDGGGRATRVGQGTVRVRFSPRGIQADDVIIGLVDQFPPAVPLVVVSSDRRIADAARRRGATVVGSELLAAVLC